MQGVELEALTKQKHTDDARRTREKVCKARVMVAPKRETADVGTSNWDSPLASSGGKWGPLLH
jgi:hypothetical protein